MGFWKLNKQVRTGLGPAVLLAVLPPIALAQGPQWLTPGEALARARPCSCHPGIEQIENFLKETTDALHAWQQVEQELENQTMTKEEARAEWHKFHPTAELDDGLFGCNMRMGKVGMTAGGFFSCEPRVSQAFVDCTCDIIVASTIAHEAEHCFMNRLPTSWITLNLGRSLAASEVAAHMEQMRFLQQELEQLRKKCRPKPPSSSDEGRERDEAKQRTANAANRAGQYANAIH